MRAANEGYRVSPHTPRLKLRLYGDGDPESVAASGVFKKKGRWYARLGCPRCTAQLKVKLSLGPMVARCEECAIDVEADVRRVVSEGRA
jgi:hypothetical protein